MCRYNKDTHINENNYVESLDDSSFFDQKRVWYNKDVRGAKDDQGAS